MISLTAPRNYRAAENENKTAFQLLKIIHILFEVLTIVFPLNTPVGAHPSQFTFLGGGGGEDSY